MRDAMATKSVFDDIIEYGEKHGGLTLEEFVDLSDVVEGNRLWRIYGYGWQLQKLINEIVSRGWDDSIVGKTILDARDWVGERRLREAEEWLRENFGTISPSRPGRWLEAPFSHETRWELIGSNTPEVYRQAGFDFEVMPTLRDFLLNTETGEISDNYRYHIASGVAFEKVVRDYKEVVDGFPRIRDLDPDFPSMTRSVPLACDPLREDFPHMMPGDNKLMITIYPSGYYHTGGGWVSQESLNALKGRSVDERKPYGLTPGGKPKKNLLSVCFQATTPKRNTEMLVWIQYGPEGVVNSYNYTLNTRKGRWKVEYRKHNEHLDLYSAVRWIDRGKKAGFYVLHDESGKLVPRIGKPGPQEYW